MLLRDQDETEEEENQIKKSRDVLKTYADRLYKLPPKIYKVDQEARSHYNAWWGKHNRYALDPSNHKVIQALYGKAGAHALRVAGLLHLVWCLDSDELETSVVSLELMKLATEIVDQCLQETELFHNQPADRTLRYMQHISKVARDYGGEVTYKLSHAKATWKGGRGYKTKDFANCVQKLCDQGYGEVVEETSPLTYRSLRPMPGDITDMDKQRACQPKPTAAQSLSKKRRF